MNLSIAGPVFALAGWTFCLLLLVLIVRLTAAAQGKVGPADFRLAESVRVPEWVQRPHRNYMSLLELPVLFYVICIVMLVTQQQTEAMVQAAWGYVALRILHSMVHLTINQVVLRLLVFVASNIVLLSLWLMAGFKLLAVSQTYVS